MWGIYSFKAHFISFEYILYGKENTCTIKPKLFLIYILISTYHEQTVSVILIFWLYGKTASGVTNVPVIGGIIGCCVILILCSLMGLLGTWKHHQVILFFYMILLFILFVIQFSMACSALTIDTEHQRNLARDEWMAVNDGIKAEVQDKFNCCGLNSTDSEHPTCTDLPCCGGGLTSTIDPMCLKCEPCLPKLVNVIDEALRIAGRFGIFFSFSQVSSDFHGIFVHLI